MGKLEYLDALKRAMLGLPPDIQAKTLAYYEQRFVDAVGSGASEQDVAGLLDEPKKIAMTLRANAHFNDLSAAAPVVAPAAVATPAFGGFAEKKDPANFLRLTVSAVGLAIFNLFMIVPAIVYSALLFSLCACALACYLVGIAATASGLAGANDLVLDWPARFVIGNPDSRSERQTRIVIGGGDIQVSQENAKPGAGDAAAAPATPREHSRVVRGAEAVADSSVHISTDMDAESRTTQTLIGIGMVLGGIVLFLLSLVVTRYTWIGLKRYVQMNRSFLRGH